MAVPRYIPSAYRSTPVCPNACMLAMLGGRGYSSRIASVVASVLKRTRAPEGDFARFHTGAGNVSCDAAGSRKNSPSFRLNHGSPSISKSVLDGGSQRSSASARSSGIVSREVRKARRAIIDADYSTSPPCGKIRQMNRCLVFLMLSVAYGQVQKPFTVVEATIPQMQRAMRQGRVTSRQLVMQYLVRIGLYEDMLHAAITVTRDARKEAEALDRERAQGKLRGPLHGIPVALKDNIHTTNMPTTGGALAFDGFVPPYEATLTRNLREAGAITIAKTGMTELANWVAGGPTPMPANYNAVAGFGMNPYDPRRDPREATFDGRPPLTTSGSSSGIGTAASFLAANVGRENPAPILNPET